MLFTPMKNAGKQNTTIAFKFIYCNRGYLTMYAHNVPLSQYGNFSELA